jgi:hypothetical protein
MGSPAGNEPFKSLGGNMSENQKHFQPEDIVVEASPVPELSDETPKGTTVLSTTVERFERRAPGVPAVQYAATEDAIVVALKTGATPDLIEKLMDLEERRMDLAERDKANIGKEAFVKAVADFKKKAPVVVMDKKNTHFDSPYASKGRIVNTIAPAMAVYGLTHRWEIKQPDKMVEVTCFLTHELGHSEKSMMQAPPDTSGGGSKNPIQQIKSTRTYLQVATFEDVTGTAAGADSDDDGNLAGKDPEYINTDQCTEISELLKESGVSEDKILKFAKAKTIETITTSYYDSIKKKLNANLGSTPEPGEDG